MTFGGGLQYSELDHMQAPEDDDDVQMGEELAPGEEDAEDYYCDVCGDGTWIEGNWLLLCDGAGCDGAYHTLCLDPPPGSAMSTSPWYRTGARLSSTQTMRW